VQIARNWTRKTMEIKPYWSSLYFWDDFRLQEK
jgi:hypothetical protein